MMKKDSHRRHPHSPRHHDERRRYRKTPAEKVITEALKGKKRIRNDLIKNAEEINKHQQHHANSSNNGNSTAIKQVVHECLEQYEADIGRLEDQLMISTRRAGRTRRCSSSSEEAVVRRGSSSSATKDNNRLLRDDGTNNDDDESSSSPSSSSSSAGAAASSSSSSSSSSENEDDNDWMVGSPRSSNTRQPHNKRQRRKQSIQADTIESEDDKEEEEEEEEKEDQMDVSGTNNLNKEKGVISSSSDSSLSEEEGAGKRDADEDSNSSSSLSSLSPSSSSSSSSDESLSCSDDWEPGCSRSHFIKRKKRRLQIQATDSSEGSDEEEEEEEEEEEGKEKEEQDDGRHQYGGEDGHDDECDDDDVEEDDDLDTENDDEIRAEIETIRNSKLGIAIQGLRKSSRSVSSIADGGDVVEDATAATSRKRDLADSDPEFVDYRGRRLYKGRCYRYNDDSSTVTIVGIRRFVLGNNNKKKKKKYEYAECVLIVPFSETYLGRYDEGIDYDPTTFEPTSHVQVREEGKLPVLYLKYFVDEEVSEPKTIPDLIYEPQTTSARHDFAYRYDKKPKRVGRRSKIRMLEVFSGCGGMHQGYKRNGFVTIKAIDNDEAAIETFSYNNPGVPILQCDVRTWLKRYKNNPAAARRELGRIDHIQLSSPCQGFSGANIFGGENDLENNELSYIILEVVQLLRPVTVTFENVVGMWRRKHHHYIKNILAELMKQDYQVRCCKLMACDHGDPQTRPRLFIFAAHPSAVLPRQPPISHSVDDDDNLDSFVTVKEALGGVTEDMNNSSDCAKTTCEPGTHGRVRLQPDGLAPAIRGRGPKPYHYEEYRCINVREAASLQSFPHDYIIFGRTLVEKYMQVGNAVPVLLATAVAQSVRKVLEYCYDGEDDNN